MVPGLAIFSETASASTSRSTSSLQSGCGGTKGRGMAPIIQLKLNPSTIALGKVLYVHNLKYQEAV